MANLLIIGGSGFFGKSILDAYKRGLLKSWNIESIDIISRNAELLKISNPGLIGHNIRLLNMDISNCSALPAADIIIHAAASTDASRYLSFPAEERANILASTKNFCNIARAVYRSSRIIYASSGAVYGQQPTKIEKITEDYPLGLIEDMIEHKRDYAAAKRDAENEILKLGADGFDVSIARCFNFIGPYLPRDQHFAFGNFINDGIKGKKIIVNARHMVVRAHQHSDDLVNWLMTIAGVANPTCPIYNVGSERSIEVRDLAQLVANYFNVETSMQSIEGTKIDRYVPSTQKIRKELGLNILIDLEEALDRTVWDIKKLAKDKIK